jgi:hypothetical protein
MKTKFYRKTLTVGELTEEITVIVSRDKISIRACGWERSCLWGEDRQDLQKELDKIETQITKELEAEASVILKAEACLAVNEYQQDEDGE